MSRAGGPTKSNSPIRERSKRPWQLQAYSTTDQTFRESKLAAASRPTPGERLDGRAPLRRRRSLRIGLLSYGIRARPLRRFKVQGDERRALDDSPVRTI